jgi:hypothetical protein
MDTDWLGEFKFPNNISTESKVGILINPLGNAAQKFMFRIKNMGETSAYSRCSLYSRERDLTHIIRISHPETSLHLIKRKMFLESSHIGIHMPNILGIQKNKGFLQIEAQSQNILDIFQAKSCVFRNIFIPFMEIFLIVGNLDNQRDIKGFLHVFSEHEGNQMAQMHSFAKIIDRTWKVLFLCRDRKVFLFHNCLIRY